MAHPTPTSNALARMFTMHNLIRAWESVSMKNAAPGIDGVTVDAFARNWRDQLTRLQGEILGGGYRPQPYIVFPKAKKNGGVRELVNGTVRDKIVARVAADELTFRHDRNLLPQSYAYRPHRGALKAVSAVERHYGKATHALRADIEDFFDTLDHQLLHARLCRMGEAPSMADFLLLCTAVDRFDGVSKRRMDAGVPQGSPLAPILSNIYLHPLDEALNEGHYHFVRYADDILVLAGHPDQANGALGLIQEQLDHLRLHLSIDKTRVHSIDGGFVFLGFLFGPNGKTACQEARRHLHEMMDSPRYSDETEDEYLIRLEAMRRGWKNYYGETGEADAGESQPTANAAVVATVDVDAEATPDAEAWAPAQPPPSVVESDEEEEEEEEEADLSSEESAVPPAEGQGTGAAGGATGFAAEFQAAGDLWRQGLINEAVCRVRRLLNNDDEPLASTDRRRAAGLLADIYERQGLTGAARRCRQSAGIEEKKIGPQDDKPEAPEFGARDIEDWLAVFGQGEGPVARQYVDATGRQGYRPASGKLTPAYLRDHWAGRHTLAVPVYADKETSRFALLDLDVTRRVVDTLDEDGLAAMRRKLRDDAVGLLDIAHRAGVDGVLEDSGCKGYHVWFFFHDALTASLTRRFLAGLCQVAGPPPDGTHRELFPNSDTRPADGTSTRIKLPMGFHRLTERRCAFLHADGGECGAIEQLNMVRVRNRAGQLRRAIETWERANGGAGEARATQPGAGSAAVDDDVARIERLCPVLRALEAKAAGNRDLTHYERMVVRGILAPLGEKGVARIHAVFRDLDNYNYALTERMIKAAPKQPISCLRVREILGDFADEAGCRCTFKPRKGRYAHPLRHLTENGGTVGRKDDLEPGGRENGEAAARHGRERTRRETDAASDATGAMDSSGDSAGPEALIGAYRAARRRLLALQCELEKLCGDAGCLELPLGVLRASGADRELKHWAIEL